MSPNVDEHVHVLVSDSINTYQQQNVATHGENIPRGSERREPARTGELRETGAPGNTTV